MSFQNFNDSEWLICRKGNKSQSTDVEKNDTSPSSKSCGIENCFENTQIPQLEDGDKATPQSNKQINKGKGVKGDSSSSPNSL